MRTFEQMAAYLAPAVPDLTWFEPGPALPDIPDRFVVLTRYGGPGEDLEGAMDWISWQVRVAGRALHYSESESMADAIDRRMMNLETANIAGVHIAGVTRVGGAPTALSVDDDDRTNFTCSYNVCTSFFTTGDGYTPVGRGGGRIFQGHGEMPGSPAVDLSSATQNDYYVDLDSGILYNATGVMA